jgi:ribosomal protein L32
MQMLTVVADRQHEIIDLLKVVKEVDAVEVVRCKDCGHYETGRRLMPYCKCPKGLKEPSDNRFCSYGERRDNGI